MLINPRFVFTFTHQRWIVPPLVFAYYDCVKIKYNIHMPGVDNVVADTLSRPPPVDIAGLDSCQPALLDQPAHHVAAVSPSLDCVSIAKNQLTCPSTEKAQTSFSVQLLHVNVKGHQLLCDGSRGGQRPLIPEVDRKRVFQAFHGLSHHVPRVV
jgi:hypothetical protein